MIAMPRKGAPLLLMLCCTLAVVLLHAADSLPLLSAENFVRDHLARRAAPASPDPRLVFLAIDGDSVTLEKSDLEEFFDLTGADEDSRRALHLMAKGWPWSRQVYGLILDRLARAGAKVVAFDATFPSRTPDDAPFREALERHRSKVVIGGDFASGSAPNDALFQEALDRYRGDSDSSGATATFADASNRFAAISATFRPPADSLVPAASVPDERVGFVNFWPSTGDIIREARYQLLFTPTGDATSTADGQRYNSFAARVVARATGRDLADPETHILRFSGPARTFPPRSAFEIFVPDYWTRNYANGEFFRDKIVVVGAHGNWQTDEHYTSLGLMPGPELQINAINALLHGHFLRELPLAARVGLIALSLPLAWVVCAFFRRHWIRGALALCVNLAWLGAAYLLCDAGNLFVPIVAPLCALNLNGVCALICETVAGLQEKKKVRLALERYVSRNVVQELLDNPRAYMRSLGGEVRPATILFSDIRNFSVATASTDPQELVAQLNEYLSAMVGCVFAHGGTLDKFIGDAVMAVWGNARSDGPAADAGNALRAAIDMRLRLRELNRKWAAEQRPPLEIGVALNHGEVVVGNIGSPQRMEYTVIGDAVNVTWRLQEMTKEFSGQLLMGESVAELVRGKFPVNVVGECALPRTGALVRVFALDEPAEKPGPGDSRVQPTSHVPGAELAGLALAVGK